jgi:hypothetical protein
MVKQASGHTMSSKTAERVWDRTVKPYGVYHGLLKKSYMAAQAGSSKRTQAGNYELQKVWYETVSEVKKKVEDRAMEILQDADLVRKILPFLFNNLDEECLHAIAKNEKVVGSARMKKHNNQNNSSRSVLDNALIFVTKSNGSNSLAAT